MRRLPFDGGAGVASLDSSGSDPYRVKAAEDFGDNGSLEIGLYYG